MTMITKYPRWEKKEMGNGKESAHLSPCSYGEGTCKDCDPWHLPPEIGKQNTSTKKNGSKSFSADLRFACAEILHFR